MKNLWCSYDALEPFLAWDLVVPAPSAPDDKGVIAARVVAEDVCAAGRDSGVVDVVVGVAAQREWLPFEDELFSGEPLQAFRSTVVVRDGVTGAFVTKTGDDAGALLRSLEGGDDAVDAVWARRFAAPHPFVGVFSRSTDKSLSISVVFFSTLFFDESDPELLAQNQPALLRFRAALLAIAQRRGGRLTAPTTTSSTSSTSTTSTTSTTPSTSTSTKPK